MPEEHDESREATPAASSSDGSAGAPGVEGGVLATREGKVVQSLAHILALAQCVGVAILGVAMLAYHTGKAADELAVSGLGGGQYGDIIDPNKTAVGPWVLLIPVLFAVLIAVAWGLWHVRAWGRRLAMVLSLLMIAGGLGIAYTVKMDIDQDWLLAEAESGAIFSVKKAKAPEPAAESAAESATESSSESATESTAESSAESATESATESSTESAAGPAVPVPSYAQAAPEAEADVIIAPASTLDDADEAEQRAEQRKNILIASAALAAFYAVVLGLLALPTVKRVFIQATLEHAASERKFAIKDDQPRDHFDTGRDVAQL